MLDALKDHHKTTLTPGLEDVVAGVDVTVVPTQPPLPPTRFGAIRIPMEPEPDCSAIKIVECPQPAAGEPDYMVYINREIRGAVGYYADLLLLLATVSSDKQIDIYIGSQGGNLYCGGMIANAVKTCKAKTTTIASGMCASAAALIWAYGQTKKVQTGAVIMVHMSSHADWGNSEKIRGRAEFTVRYVKEVCIDPMLNAGLLTADEAECITDQRRDVWISSATMQARLEKAHG